MKNIDKHIGSNDQKVESTEGSLQTFLKAKKSVKLFTIFGLLFVTFIFTISLTQINKIKTEYSLDQFFPKKHSLITQSTKIRKTFELQEKQPFLVILKNQTTDWLEPQQMQGLRKFSQELAKNKEIQSTLSLATLEGALQSQNELNVGPLFENLKPQNWQAYVNKNELIKSQLISEDKKSTLILVEPKKVSTLKLLKIQESIQSFALKTFKNTQVEIGGVPAIQSQLSSQLGHDLKFYILLSLVAFASVFMLFFRSFSALVLTMFNLTIANIMIIAGIAYFKIPFSILLSTLPIIASIALISVHIHTLHRWAELVPNTSPENRFKTSVEALKEMFSANFLGSITTSIGFVTLCFTDIPLIKEYGWVVAASILLVWIVSQINLFFFMHLIAPKLRKWTELKSYWALPILKKSDYWLMGTLTLTLLFALFGTRMNFSSRLFDDLPKNSAARSATEKIDSDFGGVVSYDLNLNSKKADFWKEPKNLETLKTLMQHIRTTENVGSAITMTDFFDSQKIPKTKQAVSEFMFLFSLAEKNPLKNYVTENGKSLLISIRLNDVSGKKIKTARLEVQDKVSNAFKDVTMLETGLAVTSHSINQNVSKELVYNFWHSIAIVGILLAFVFKSIRWALVACIPNFIPPAILMGSLALTNTPVKPGVAIIFSIALGLAFNNTVYFLSRLKNIMKQKNMTHLPIKQAILQEGNPCLFESLVMFAGFAIFMSSGFKMNQTFGLFMILSIISGTIADLFFLPSLLKIFPSLLISKNKKLSSQNKNNNVGIDMGDIQKIAASILLVFVFIAPKAMAANADAASILKATKAQLESKDDSAQVKMIITEANGESKSRTMQLQTLRDKSFHALIRLESPADIKGTAFLAKISPTKEEQWIYLPSTKQVRRVVGSKKSGGILGSELTAEDLNSTAIKGSSIKLIKSDSKFDVIELTPVKGSSQYSKVHISIEKKQKLPVLTEYYQGSSKKKIVQFLDYKKIGNVFRAQKVAVKNLSNKRGTTLLIKDISVNNGFTTDDFTESSLKP